MAEEKDLLEHPSPLPLLPPLRSPFLPPPLLMPHGPLLPSSHPGGGRLGKRKIVPAALAPFLGAHPQFISLLLYLCARVSRMKKEEKKMGKGSERRRRKRTGKGRDRDRLTEEKSFATARYSSRSENRGRGGCTLAKVLVSPKYVRCSCKCPS